MAEGHQHPYVEFEGSNTRLALDLAMDALVQNKDVIEQTDRRYIVGARYKALAEAEDK